MKKNLKIMLVSLLIVTVLGLTGCGNKEEKGFKPKLDTEKSVVINTAGFFGNFEALDQVTDDFNKFYPNVEFNYEQIGIENFEDYLSANPEVDILMTSEEVFDKLGDKLENYCVDLNKEKINLDAIEKDMLEMKYHDGKLSAIPMGQNLYGLVVNVDLLEKEGLSVPNNFEEFTSVLKVLKDKGYTPIQGPNSKIYAEISQGMLFDMLLSDNQLYDDLMAGKESAIEELKKVFDKLKILIDEGYIDYEVNKAYPDDNYDQAILKFFEGDVPFWVCNTEKVSGMKKRESKSETFQNNPFEYRYIYAPLGDDGVYVYREPWFGFSVNKYGANYEYAIEFIRFLATKDEINKIADVKGVPSVAVENNDIEIYSDVMNPKKIEMSCVNNGNITPQLVTNWYSCLNKYMSGEIATEEDALKYFIELCSKQDKE